MKKYKISTFYYSPDYMSRPLCNTLQKCMSKSYTYIHRSHSLHGIGHNRILGLVPLYRNKN